MKLLPTCLLLFSWLVIGLLILFTFRRFKVLLAAARPAGSPEPGVDCSIAVIASFLNEQENLPGLLESLDRLEYPQEKIHFVLVDDGSQDRSQELVRDWTAERSNAFCLALPQTVGKAEALNRALAAAPGSELIAVYDADLRPQPQALRCLAGAFRDSGVAAVSGFRRPLNASAGMVAAYGALESLVHQLVTQVGKENLGINPTTLGGNCVYRRSALEQSGGFPPRTFSEDIEVSLDLVAKGWRTRFVRGAVADSLLVVSLRRYWNQRSRWTRGLYRSRRRASNLESRMVAAGYLDRLAFLAALLLAIFRQISPLWPALYCVGPAAAIAFALRKANLGARFTIRALISMVFLFPVDVAVSLAASINALLDRRQRWMTGGASR
jgi:cellulose synthase/poly-beta-1,6-N-acetylglucosamine synthase-like glycosyltransferase